MATRVDIRRPAGGIVKVDFSHLGSDSIQTSLRKTLLGDTGEDQTHILEIRELAADISQHFCLSTVNANNESQYLFKVMGRYHNRVLRDVNGVFQPNLFYLGDRSAPPGVQNLGGVLAGVNESTFTMYSPQAYSQNDVLWHLNQRVSRISDILNTMGWTNNIDLNNHNGYSRTGPLPPTGAVGGGPGTPILRRPAIEENDEKAPEDVLSLEVTPGGYIGLRGTAEFWNAFFIQCSPYFRSLTGYPEILCRTVNVSGEVPSLQVAGAPGQWIVIPGNTRAETFLASKSLFSTFEERKEILISSALPTPFERHITNNEEKHRFTLGYWHIRGFHETWTNRTVKNHSLNDEWSLENTTVVGKTVMDRPIQTGYNCLILPSSIPSLNIRAYLRRRQWNFETNRLEFREVPLMQNKEDLLTLRLIFTLQQ